MESFNLIKLIQCTRLSFYFGTTFRQLTDYMIPLDFLWFTYSSDPLPPLSGVVLRFLINYLKLILIVLTTFSAERTDICSPTVLDHTCMS